MTSRNFTRDKHRSMKRKGGATRRAIKMKTSPELLTRDHVARCVHGRLRKGGLPHGGSFWTLRGSKKKFQMRQPYQTQTAKRVSSIQRAYRRIYHEGAHGSQTDHPLHYGQRSRDADSQMTSIPGLCCWPVCSTTSWREQTWWEFTFGSSGLRTTCWSLCRGICFGIERHDG